MSAYTKGPWHTVKLTKQWGVYEQDGTSIAKVGDAYGVIAERREANARLIAASPTMYEYIASKANAGDEDAARIIASINAPSR